MGIKSTNGQSSVNTPKMSPKANPNTGVIIADGKHIVHKPINRHNGNPGYKVGK